MSFFTIRFSLGVFVLLGASVLLTGCNGADADSMIAAANDTNVKRLATLYTYFHIQNKNLSLIHI